jgi:hypothetical protein
MDGCALPATRWTKWDPTRVGAYLQDQIPQTGLGVLLSAMLLTVLTHAAGNRCMTWLEILDDIEALGHLR